MSKPPSLVPPSNVCDLAAVRLTQQSVRERRAARESLANMAYNAEMTSAREEFVAKDSLVQATTQGKADPATILKAIRTEIAREQAELRFQRLEAEKQGRAKDPAASKNRIDALVKIAHIELEIRKLGAESIDLKSEHFQRVFALWIDSIREVAVELFTPEQVDLFFNSLTTKLDGWETRAADVLR